MYAILSLSSLTFSQEVSLEQNILPEKTGFTAVTKDGRKVIYNKMLSTTTVKGTSMEKNSTAQVAQMLAQLLADEYVLYTKTYKFHWNVKGKNFGPLHSFFQDHYEQLAEFVDGVAERSLMIGHDAPGTLQEFLQLTTLSEEPGQNPSDIQMLTILLANHETIIGHLRNMINKTAELNDASTNNFLTDLLEKHEKIAWMIRAHLQ